MSKPKQRLKQLKKQAKEMGRNNSKKRVLRERPRKNKPKKTESKPKKEKVITPENVLTHRLSQVDVMNAAKSQKRAKSKTRKLQNMLNLTKWNLEKVLH